MTETQVKFIGHTTVLISSATTKVVIDPNLSDHLLLLKRKDQPVFDPMELHQVQAVLFTNPRFNRLDLYSLRFFRQKSTQVLTSKGLSTHLRRYYSFPSLELEANQEITVGDIKITALPTRHFCLRFLTSHTVGLNYLIKTPDKTIFYGTDAKYAPDFFSSLGQKYPIDLAVLPIDYVVHDFVAKGNFMTAKEAVHAFQDLNAQMLLPVAHGSFSCHSKPADRARQNLMQELDLNRSLKEKVKLLTPGESLTL